MEMFAGGALAVIGLLIIVFGSTRFEPRGAEGERPPSLPAWLDAAIKWGMGLVCLWFGAALILRGVHF